MESNPSKKLRNSQISEKARMFFMSYRKYVKVETLISYKKFVKVEILISYKKLTS